MNAKIKTIVAVAAFVLLLGGSYAAYSLLSKTAEVSALPSQQSLPARQEKNPAPDFAVTTKDGTVVKLSDFLGKPVVINFWASWCPPCKAELPDFQRVYDEMKDSVAFLMIDLVDGQRETVSKGAKFIAGSGYTFPVYFDTMQECASRYGIDAIPTTLFIDSEGFVAAAHRGQLNEALLRKGIGLIYK